MEFKDAIYYEKGRNTHSVSLNLKMNKFVPSQNPAMLPFYFLKKFQLHSPVTNLPPMCVHAVCVKNRRSKDAYSKREEPNGIFSTFK